MENDASRMTSRDLLAIERRKQILEEARKLFVEKGYHAASMRAINRAVGMSDVLTYHYFPEGKLQIFNTMIKELQEARESEKEKSINALKDDMPLKEGLALLADIMADRFEADRDFMQIMIQERKMLGADQMQLLSSMGEGFISSFARFLQAKAEQGEMRFMNFNMATSQFICHISVYAMQGILYEPAFDRVSYLSDISGIVAFTAALWAA
jgi:AcrR family transcriptional regulator